MGLITSNSPPIRVLIADDSAVMRAALSRVIESDPALQVCGTARHGLEALEKVRQLRPDVVTLDVEMPVLNGLEVLKRIMKEFPRPVIMVSSLTKEGAEVTLEALGVGAFAQMTDNTQATNTAGAGINKALSDEIGGSRGNVTTPGSAI